MMTQGTQFLHAADPVKSHPLTYRATFPFTVCRFLSEFAVPFPQFVVSLSNLLPPFHSLVLLFSICFSLLQSAFYFQYFVSSLNLMLLFPSFLRTYVVSSLSTSFLSLVSGVPPPHFYCTLQLVLPLYFITDNILIALFNDVFNYYDYI